MIAGIGVDLLRVERGDALWSRFGTRAADKLLHPAEAEALPRAKSPGYALARAFAAKEAFVKALGTGFRGVAYRDIRVLRDGLGKPCLRFSQRLADRLGAQGVTAAHLSLSDEGGFVLAFVVLEGAVPVSAKIQQ